MAASVGDAAAPVDEPIDLLHGARTDLAVSSAYRDRRTQAELLVDGDLTTAWNSKSGDLAGAWIEVRLPEKANVTAIALTAGFTKVNDGSDLFTGNHRVSKVRILRAGQELGVFDLDTDSRELQTFPVKGSGGVYRIEVVAVVPGSRAQWREVCVSELRIMGRAPDVHAGGRFPRVNVGELPEPRPEPGTTDRAKVGTVLRQQVSWFATEWGALNDEQAARHQACGLTDEDTMATAGYQLRRRQLFGRVADLVELVDEVHSDRLRYAAVKQVGRGRADWDFLQPEDHEVLAAGFEAVVAWLADEEARCRWSRTDSGLRLRRVVGELGASNHRCEHITQDYSEDDPPPAELRRECRVVDRALPRVGELGELWESNPRLAALELRRLALPGASPGTLAELEGLQAQLEVARRSCGWVRE